MTKSEKTRQYIIEKTAPIFNKQGFAGTSLNDMIEITGLSKGSIYGNFENKDAVAIAVFEFNLKNLQYSFRSEMDKRNSYKEKLLVFPDSYEGFYIRLIENGGCPILNTAIEADDTHPQLKQHASKAIEDWKKQLIYLLNKGIEAEEFSLQNDSVEQFALTMLATIEGAIMITKLTGKLNNLKMIMDSVKNDINNLK